MSDVYLFAGATDPKDVILRPIPPLVPEVHKYHLPMARLEMKPRAWSIISRAGERIGLRRPHKPFVPERPIQPA